MKHKYCSTPKSNIQDTHPLYGVEEFITKNNYECSQRQNVHGERHVLFNFIRVVCLGGGDIYDLD